MGMITKIVKTCRYVRNGMTANFCEPGWDTFICENGRRPQRIKLGRHDWHRDFVADPFLFHNNGYNWLFYETVDFGWKGKIGCFKEVNECWEQQGIVLERPWHMSYPQVFEDDGHIYMIPEQSNLGSGNVSLYEASDFPYKWEHRRILIDRPFADATLLKWHDHYYMACYTIPPIESAELWHAPSLLGPWERHPMWKNINQSPRLRRCAGRFIERDGCLYRMAQDCNGCYGKRVFAVKVLEISPTVYQEGRAEVFLDKTTRPHAFKHTYNEMFVDGRKICVFDAQTHVLLPIYSVIKRALARIGRVFKGQKD